MWFFLSREFCGNGWLGSRGKGGGEERRERENTRFMASPVVVPKGEP